MIGSGRPVLFGECNVGFEGNGQAVLLARTHDEWVVPQQGLDEVDISKITAVGRIVGPLSVSSGPLPIVHYPLPPLHPSSFILHPFAICPSEPFPLFFSSFIIHPSSFIIPSAPSPHILIHASSHFRIITSTNHAGQSV